MISIECKTRLFNEFSHMTQFMEADISLCRKAEMPYDYNKHLNESLRMIADRFNLSFEEVSEVYEEFKDLPNAIGYD